MEHYTICEYQSFTCEIELHNDNYKPLKEDTFNKLKQFILESKGSSETEGLELMSHSSRKGIGEIITAKNYVGVIAMPDGTVIEVLPKISNSSKIEESQKLLLVMLKTVKDLPFKTFNMAHLNVERIRIFEVFISMFINEVKLLVQKGLKSDYVLHQDNEKFLKGKLLFHNHLKHNLVHKERFFVEYHLYDINRPENRIIKTALRYLFRFSNSAKNKKDLHALLNVFDEVQDSMNVDADFEKCSNGRDMRAYEQVLRWCEVFLRGNSFTNSKGDKRATALLFPMEQLFESYVAEHLRKALIPKNYEVRIQEHKYHLFKDIFRLKPDIVVENIQNKKIVVLDTKWKVLNGDKGKNYGISQGDIYQMYAYGKKYDTERVVLLYPMNEMIGKDCKFNFTPSDNDSDKVNVHVRFLDLKDEERFIDKIVVDIEQDFPAIEV